MVVRFQCVDGAYDCLREVWLLLSRTMSHSPSLFLADIDLGWFLRVIYIDHLSSNVNTLLPAKARGCGNLKDNIGLY